MSYDAQYALSVDPDFSGRCQAAITQQAAIFNDDARAEFVQLAQSLLKGPSQTTYAFITMIAAAPGFAEAVDTGGGVIDQTQVADAQVLAAVQGLWPVVAELFYVPPVEP